MRTRACRIDHEKVKLFFGFFCSGYYRQQTAPLWQKYGLFTHKGLRARLGSAKDDLSILILYVAADKYLKPKGKLGFVITQTIFKTEGGGAGFRRLKLGYGDPLRVIQVDDFSDIQCFEGATNRTAVALPVSDAHAAKREWTC